MPINGPPAVPKIVRDICTSESPISTKDSPIHTSPKNTAVNRIGTLVAKMSLLLMDASKCLQIQEGPA